MLEMLVADGLADPWGGNVVVRSKGSGTRCPRFNLGCVTLNKLLLNFSVSQLPRLKNGDNSI